MTSEHGLTIAEESWHGPLLIKWRFLLVVKTTDTLVTRKLHDDGVWGVSCAQSLNYGLPSGVVGLLALNSTHQLAPSWFCWVKSHLEVISYTNSTLKCADGWRPDKKACRWYTSLVDNFGRKLDTDKLGNWWYWECQRISGLLSSNLYS